GQSIPNILDTWRVVEAYAKEKIRTAKHPIIYESQIEIIPCKGAANAIIGELAEPAEMLAESARCKDADLINGRIVVDVIMRWRRGCLILLSVNERVDHHCGERGCEIRTRAQRISTEFKLTAEWGELGAKAAYVTCATWNANLLRKSWNCLGLF